MQNYEQNVSLPRIKFYLGLIRLLIVLCYDQPNLWSNADLFIVKKT